jgi:hypothetical protein
MTAENQLPRGNGAPRARLIPCTVVFSIQSGSNSLRWLMKKDGTHMIRTTRFGTWNITSLTGKKIEIVEDMKKYNLSLLGTRKVKKKTRINETERRIILEIYWSG